MELTLQSPFKTHDSKDNIHDDIQHRYMAGFCGVTLYEHTDIHAHTEEEEDTEISL